MSVKTRGKSVIHLKMIKMQKDDGAAVGAEEDNDAPDRLTYGINNRTIPEWDEKVHWQNYDKPHNEPEVEEAMRIANAANADTGDPVPAPDALPTESKEPLAKK